MAQGQTLRDLLIDEIRDLYDAERQLVKALPKMERAASDKDLKKAFADHLKQTEKHIDRLDRIFAKLEFKPGGQRCAGMEGLLKEASDMASEDAPPDVKDAGLIAAAQRVEHYEMAGYGVVRTYAEKLGDWGAADILQQTLNEEALTDQRLSRLATRKINFVAMDG
jgi:ferritin-like metal-binding protein YciE